METAGCYLGRFLLPNFDTVLLEIVEHIFLLET
jgi:hypothetical protein